MCFKIKFKEENYFYLFTVKDKPEVGEVDYEGRINH